VRRLHDQSRVLHLKANLQCIYQQFFCNIRVLRQSAGGCHVQISECQPQSTFRTTRIALSFDIRKEQRVYAGRIQPPLDQTKLRAVRVEPEPIGRRYLIYTTVLPQEVSQL
jgi:hypothetical protein